MIKKTNDTEADHKQRLGFQTPSEIVEYRQRVIRFFFAVGAAVMLSLGSIAFGLTSALSTTLSLDRIHQTQTQNFEELSKKLSLLFTLDVSKAKSTVDAISLEGRGLISEIYAAEREAQREFETVGWAATIFFNKDLTIEQFSLVESEMESLESILQLIEDNTVRQGLTNIIHLRPIEAAFIQRRPWSKRFSNVSATIRDALDGLVRTESFFLSFSAALLTLAAMVTYFTAFRPSFSYLNRTLERHERMEELRHGLISFTNVLTSDQSTPANGIEQLNQLAARYPELKGVVFHKAHSFAAASAAGDENVIASGQLSTGVEEYLVVELPEDFVALRNEAQPYLNVISQHLRLRSELKMRHRLESDRDKALDLAASILENFSNPVLVIKNGLVVMANPAACAFFQAQQRRLLFRSLDDINALHEELHRPLHPEFDLISLPQSPNSTYLYRYQDGRSFEWSIIEGEDNSQSVFVGQDFTEILRDVAALEQKRKLEMLGKISGTIAHDTNNFLAVIQNTLEMVRLEPAISGKTLQFLNAAQRSCQNAVHLNRKLVSYSRRQDLVPERFQPSAVIPEVKTFVNSSYPNVQLETKILADPSINLDKAYLVSSLINVVKNAAAAMGGTGKITLELSERQDKCFRFRICDEGPGFSQEGLKEALQPFYSEGKMGTGLGLSSVDGFARQSDGWVELSNRGGACIDLIFPAQDISIDRREVEQDSTVQYTLDAPRKIFLLEDNAELSNLIQSYFGRENFEIHTAASVEQGLLLLNAQRVTYDILILDLVLPDGNGAQVALHSKELGMEVPIILMTGYGDETLKSDRLDFNYEFLQKPFVLTSLSERVHELLG
ncbi:response regulator [Sulfitobacter donghicola]|uniref:Histidine kinase n=1 Tax=Sulfitobacter donghicola DSW-25 = KCTC 12864 = JCM 14565 TaxID=1300350 RepID=A0A073IHB2_9RHOB|nr:response regulator [Sulfitobacter donghicola]KEJ89164.1 hypothetical protein DSW25_12635 [Sulfitobacter donghicola DSW-25 = KCTC 12864 = JCM 14565]KIN67361.1 PAS/PAC sensor hybrid histidine kinase [Sulfitobacter donghicola DSW-25 = KCTC 12864 = JCM 14565]